jgi:hypothetical protein
MAPRAEHLAEFLGALKAVPFVQEARLIGPPEGARQALTIKAGNERFKRLAVQNLSYLDRPTVHALKALAAKSDPPLIVFARYLPRPVAEEFAEAGIDFIDRAGNLHLTLGSRYARTVIGRAEAARPERERAVTATQVQVQLALAADPDLLKRPVRDIAALAGVSKSMAATLRQRLKRSAPARATSDGAIDAIAVGAYATILRPKLLLGRFRAPEKATSAFLERIKRAQEGGSFRISLTGGPAAARLQRYYEAPEVPLFIDTWNASVREALRLLPDKEGPITLLRAFGRLAFWKDVDGLTLANPVLIYAELMTSADPRAHEAAEEFRREFLTR